MKQSKNQKSFGVMLAIGLILSLFFVFCGQQTSQKDALPLLKPLIITEAAKHDTDDPAIWLHPTDPAQSLIIGTDKDEDGALYVYDLAGKIIEEKTVRNLKRPNNVDIEYGFCINVQPIRLSSRLLVEKRVRRMDVIYGNIAWKMMAPER